MKFFVALALPFIASSAPTTFDDDFSSVQIIGGTEAQAGEFPFITAFFYDGGFQCGGSLLDANTVLTAAHCVDRRVASGMTIRVGSVNREFGGVVANVSSFKMHPDYDSTTFDNDVAVLKLQTDIAENSSVTYAKLAATNNDPSSGTTLTVAGWGVTNTSTGSRSTLLLKVDVPAVSRSQCQANYAGSLITDNMFCAGLPQGGKDACQSDSGGPIVDSTKTVIGVVSWGSGCAEPNSPGVYALIGALLEFINNV